jgi:hypothetical protein
MLVYTESPKIGALLSHVHKYTRRSFSNFATCVANLYPGLFFQLMIGLMGLFSLCNFIVPKICGALGFMLDNLYICTANGTTKTIVYPQALGTLNVFEAWATSLFVLFRCTGRSHSNAWPGGLHHVRFAFLYFLSDSLFF